MSPNQALREDVREEVEAAPLPRSGTLKTASVLAGLTFLALLAIGVVPRLIRHRALSAEAEAARIREPVVSIVHAVEAPPVSEVLLPGSTQAIEDTGIYARTDGYLKARYVDLGTEVKAGERLAEIATPEIDQQLDQAEANLGEAKSNVAKLEADHELAASTLTRYLAAGTAGGVSKQQIDERTSAVKTADKAVDAARATVNAQEANVRRLRQLQGFQQVVAPFDGVITARSVDPGALISSGSQNGELRSLFRIARTDVLRVLTYVPQSDAPFIKVHQDVTVTVREFPNRVFAGTVAYTAGALDPSSRTMLAEVHVPNPDRTLLVGMYVTVHFQVERADPAILIPATSLLIDSNGVRVAVVDGAGVMHYRPVEVGRDFGTRVEVLSGLAAQEMVVNGLTGTVADGTRVRIAQSATK
jgi:RND family efflux transporter MFP subunit